MKHMKMNSFFLIFHRRKTTMKKKKFKDYRYEHVIKQLKKVSISKIK